MARASLEERAAREARLYAEVAAATEEFCRRLRIGDDAGLDAFRERRGRLLAALRALGEPPVPPPEWVADLAPFWRRSAEAIRRILELDREIALGLMERAAGIRAELAAIQGLRRTLADYRGAMRHESGSVHLDRLG